MKKAVAYMRYSSDNQKETSIEHQRVAIERYCDTNDLQLVGEFVDMAYTGKYDKRPSFQKMIRESRNNPEWSVILVYDLSRYFRNSPKAMILKERLKDRGIRVISVTQDFGESNEAFLAEGVTHLMDDYFSRNNSKVVRDSMEVKANKAGHCGGVPPLGFDVDANGELMINADEAEIVRKIFDMYENDYSYKKIAKILNDESKKTKLGRSFTKHSFNSLLHQEKYTGIFVWNRAKERDSEGLRNSHAEKPMEKQVRIDGGCPQIISKEQFRRVQEKLASRANGQATSKSSRHYMLSSMKILKCAHCGSYMVGTSRSSHGKRYTTYSCPKHKEKECPTKEIRTEYVDELVAALLCRDLHQRKDQKKISSVMKQTDESKKLVEKRRGVEKAIGNILKAMEKSDSETLVQRLNNLEKEKNGLECAIAATKFSAEGITKDNSKAVCRKFRRHLLDSESLEVKNYLTSTVKEVQISNEGISIKMKVA